MAETAQDFASLVEVMVRPLIDHEEDLDISVESPDESTVIVEVRVNDEDAGKVIGRQGRIIKSIRTLCRAAAARADMRVDVEIVS